ncbi:MAG: hypothetical protein ABGX44_04725 [Candidatus Poseidoniia archaeon]|nr:MAG: hypothetical protein CXT64_01905 [Euryarchaeota archaeon]
MSDEMVDEDMDEEEFNQKYLEEKYFDWLEIYENPEPSMFLKDGIQEIMLDDMVNDFLAEASKMTIGKYRTSNLYIAPNIPKKKLNNGLSNDRFGVKGLLKEDNVLMMVDERTALFSPKLGLMITNIGIFWNSIENGKGGLPWRINNSRVTSFMMNPEALFLGEIALEIDDELTIPIGTVGQTNDEMATFGGLLSSLIDIANEQHSRI